MQELHAMRELQCVLQHECGCGGKEDDTAAQASLKTPATRASRVDGTVADFLGRDKS